MVNVPSKPLPGTPIDFRKSFPEAMHAVRALPEGIVYRCTGPIMFYGRRVTEENRHLPFNDLPRIPIRRAQAVGPPTLQELTHAVEYLHAANLDRPLPVTTQAVVLAWAQDLTAFAEKEPRYAFDPFTAGALEAHA